MSAPSDPPAIVEPARSFGPRDEPEHVAPVQISPARRHFDPVPMLFGLGALALVLALVWLFRHPHAPVVAARPAPVVAAAPDPRFALVEAQIAALGSRLTRLEHDQSHPAGPAGPAVDELSHRVATLEGGLSGKIAGLDKQVQAAEQAGTALRQAADRAARFAVLQQAGQALDTGRTLGDLPDAPPALTRFAETAPPTEATLRLAFPAAMASVRSAVRQNGRHDVWSRITAQVQNLITLRRGDRVLFGDPAAGVLTDAQTALDAGDLAAAVARLNAAQGRVAAALQAPPMAAWRAAAQSLLDARAALLVLEQQG